MTMKIGLLLGGLDEAADLGAVAAEAERLGFDSLWAGDHIAFPAPIVDPFQILACYAAHTRRIRIGTCVYLLPLRHPTLIAKMVASLDHLSGGRVIFGVGVGGEFPGEFQACGVPVGERGARSNEAIRALRRLWQDGEVTHAGRFFEIGPVRLAPPPRQSGGPPIWVGGRSEAALRRTARLGEGYVGYMLDPQGFRRRMDRIRALAAAAGRERQHFTAAVMAFAVIDRDRSRALGRAASMLGAMYGRSMEAAAGRYCVAGTPGDCRTAARAWADVGCEHLILTPLAFGDDLGNEIRRLAEALEIEPKGNHGDDGR
jgi:probable F420-dependent oxidoreductase